MGIFPVPLKILITLLNKEKKKKEINYHKLRSLGFSSVLHHRFSTRGPPSDPLTGLSLFFSCLI